MFCFPSLLSAYHFSIFGYREGFGNVTWGGGGGDLWMLRVTAVGLDGRGMNPIVGVDHLSRWWCCVLLSTNVFFNYLLPIDLPKLRIWLVGILLTTLHHPRSPVMQIQGCTRVAFDKPNRDGEMAPLTVQVPRSDVLQYVLATRASRFSCNALSPQSLFDEHPRWY